MRGGGSWPAGRSPSYKKNQSGRRPCLLRRLPHPKLSSARAYGPGSGNGNLGYPAEAGSASGARLSGAAATAISLTARCHVLGFAAPSWASGGRRHRSPGIVLSCCAGHSACRLRAARSTHVLRPSAPQKDERFERPKRSSPGSRCPT
jgi:hypothetical protein